MKKLTFAERENLTTKLLDRSLNLLLLSGILAWIGLSALITTEAELVSLIIFGLGCICFVLSSVSFEIFMKYDQGKWGR